MGLDEIILGQIDFNRSRNSISYLPVRQCTYYYITLHTGETIMLRDIKCHNQNIFMVAETTCPVRKQKRAASTAESATPEDFKTVKTVHDLGLPEEEDDRDALEATEPVPEWLRQEFNDSEDNNNVQQRLKTPQSQRGCIARFFTLRKFSFQNFPESSRNFGLKTQEIGKFQAKCVKYEI